MKKLIIILLTSLWSIQANAGLLHLNWDDIYDGVSTTSESTVTLDTEGYGSALLSSMDSYNFTNIDSMTFTIEQVFEGDVYFDQLWINFYAHNDDSLTSFSNEYYWGDEILFSIDSLQITLDLSGLISFHFIDFEYWGDSFSYLLTNVSFNNSTTSEPDHSTPVPEPPTFAIFLIALFLLSRKSHTK